MAHLCGVDAMFRGSDTGGRYARRMNQDPGSPDRPQMPDEPPLPPGPPPPPGDLPPGGTWPGGGPGGPPAGTARRGVGRVVLIGAIVLVLLAVGGGAAAFFLMRGS